jgi:DNA-binding FadR family transcriptional regulator
VNGANQPGDGIQAERLSDVLYQRLASMIGAGGYTEGSRLPSESDLAERFSVSRPMVREVLSRLRESGVIISRKGAGSFVQRQPNSTEPSSIGFAPISSLAQVKKGYEFRIGVEGEAAFWAAKNRTPQTLAQIRASLDQLEEVIERRALGVDADYEFHLAIARASANEFFEAVLISMRAPMTFAINLSRSLSLTRPLERLRIVQAEHVAIFEAIEAGNKEAACAAMRRHIGNTCDRVFEGSVDNYGGPLPP